MVVTRVALVLLLLAGAGAAASRTRVESAVSRQADVEVAILDTKGVVVRHLAAGVVGGKATPPPLAAGGHEGCDGRARNPGLLQGLRRSGDRP